MSSPPADAWTGSVRWAVVPFAPKPPVRLFAGERHAPIAVSEPAPLIAAARRGGDPTEENAAIVSALVRVNVEAVEGGLPLGRLAEHELRVLGERVIRFFGLDTRLLVERALQELAARRREREAE